MNKETYRKIGILFPIVTAGAFTIGIITNNFVFPIFVLAIGIPLVFIAKTRVKDVIEDERHYQIGGYASRYAIAVFSLIASIIGLVLIVQESPVAVAVAHTLFVSISVILLLYVILFAYFEKKM